MNPTGYSQVLAEIDIDPATGDRTVSRYNTIGDRPLAQTEISGGTGAGARTPVYLAIDALGSVRSAQTSHQEILAQSEAYDYTAFGSPHGSQTRSLTSYAFTGQARDQDTGLQYHRARWLDTTQAQWLSQDPVFDFSGNFGNSYGYCGEDPVNGQDFSGMSNYLETEVVSAISQTLSSASTTWVVVEVIQVSSIASVSVSAWTYATSMILAVGAVTTASAAILQFFSTATDVEKRIIHEFEKLSEKYPPGGKVSEEIQLETNCDKWVKEAVKVVKKEVDNPDLEVIYFHDLIMSNGKRYTFGRIVAEPGFGIAGILEPPWTAVVGENGQHFGLIWDGRVYDNNNPLGCTEKDWRTRYWVTSRINGMAMTLQQAHDYNPRHGKIAKMSLTDFYSGRYPHL